MREPDGKIKVSVHDGYVQLEFGATVAGIGLTPDQALELADALRIYALKCIPEETPQ